MNLRQPIMSNTMLGESNPQEHSWLVETRNLIRIYGSGEQEIRALNGVNLRVKAGELVAVMGPSGSGKSTLLNLLGALDKPTSGQVLVNGQDLDIVRDLDAFRARTVGFVFQLHNLIPTLTAQENIEVPMIGHFGARERHKRSQELLALVGLQDRMHHLPSQLSGGQRQRVAVARSLANNPHLILADEPTGNLDSVAGRELMDLLRTLNRTQGSTFMIVTHDPSVARLTDRVIVMADGHIVREDIIGSALEEDLKMWRYSGLGQRILSGDLEGLRISTEQLTVLQRMIGNLESQEQG
jgi:ABC-type lipoprotein export system ATPase subunit